MDEDLKGKACAVVDAIAGELIAAAREIHANPELGYEEVFASARLAGLLRDDEEAVIRCAAAHAWKETLPPMLTLLQR